MPRWVWRERLVAAGWHLLMSAAVAMLAALLVFVLWYPGAFRGLSGGRDLFLLVVAVDVVLGPLLTLAVFDRTKGWPHLRRDLAVIVLLQLAALAYGLHTVMIVRPVALVFEQDRFRVVNAAEVYTPELDKAPEGLRELPLTGPWTLAVRESRPGQERNESIFMAVLKGVDTSQRPSFWMPYHDRRQQAFEKARPLRELIRRYPAEADGLLASVASAGLREENVRFLPVIARGDWVALLRPNGDVIDFARLDGWF
jgi:hypothetical protein